MFFKSPSAELSRAQFDAARLGFHGLLRRKGMSFEFIDRHSEDLLQQALLEYTSRVAGGTEIFDPPSWICGCAWNRTKSLLERRDYRPEEVSYDLVGERADGDASDPEGTFLAEDRARKIRQAVDELSERQQRLIALSYFEGESVREAARLLRWTPSKAQRAHESAQKKIHAILGVETTDEILLEFGLIAYLAVAVDRAGRHSLPAGAEAFLDHAQHGVNGVGQAADRLVAGARDGVPGRMQERLASGAQVRAASERGPLRKVGDLARRVLPGGPGEAGTFLASEGGTRAVEACKGLAVCLVVGGGTVSGALIGSGGHHPRPTVHHAISRPVAVAKPSAKARKTVADSESNLGVTEPTTVSEVETGSPPVTASHPAPRSSQKTAKKQQAAPAEAHDVKKQSTANAEPEASSSATEPSSAAGREAVVQERYRDFSQTESKPSTATTDSRSTSSPSSSSSSTSSTPPTQTSSSHASGNSEDAKAAKAIHGLLE